MSKVAVVLLDLFEFELVFKPIVEPVLANYVDQGVDYESYLKWAISEMLESGYGMIVSDHAHRCSPYDHIHDVVRNVCNTTQQLTLEQYFTKLCFNPRLIMFGDIRVHIKRQTLIVEYFRELPFGLRELIYQI